MFFRRQIFCHAFPSPVHWNMIFSAAFPALWIIYIIWFQTASFTTVNTSLRVSMLAVHDKISLAKPFSNTICSKLFSLTIDSWRAVSQIHWKLFSSRLSVFNSAVLAFLCAYIKRGQLKPTQRTAKYNSNI